MYRNTSLEDFNEYVTNFIRPLILLSFVTFVPVNLIYVQSLKWPIAYSHINIHYRYPN
jgi:hypothetical protein